MEKQTNIYVVCSSPLIGPDLKQQSDFIKICDAEMKRNEECDSED